MNLNLTARAFDAIAPDTQIIFVADMFVEDYVGGAELTSEALIETCPFKLHKLHSKNVTLELLQQHMDKYWIFGNFAMMDLNLLPAVIANLNYTVLEYDFKFCKHRSPQKHEALENVPCNCHAVLHGELIAAFYTRSKSIWWMSEKQKAVYDTKFPELRKHTSSAVLSSVLSARTIAQIRAMREQDSTRSKWIVLDSNSWVKGASLAKELCAKEKLDYETLWNKTHEETLHRLATAEGFVYTPAGHDTCPRMVIEAKLLGCQLKLNDNVLHKDEVWFNSSLEEIEEYLLSAPNIFWNDITQKMSWTPTISGYTTTYNCVVQDYPFVDSIKSMLSFCDEVCVVDAGSTDDTLVTLMCLAYDEEPHGQFHNLFSQVLASARDKKQTYEFPDIFATKKRSENLRVKVIWRDWSHPRSALFDGMQKAEARRMCTKEFCWQQDVDEMCHEGDVAKIKQLCAAKLGGQLLISLPVVEWWGSLSKVRIDTNPVKWRLSKNDPDITHGIPQVFRRMDQHGMYAVPGSSDGCDMISAKTGDPLPFLTVCTAKSEDLRHRALKGDLKALQEYEQWFNTIIENLPSVYHVSWLNIERKIRLYRDFWTRHWNSCFGVEYKDTAESNMFFNVPWSDVTDEMIKQRAQELASGTGGHIFHRKFDNHVTPHISVNRVPACVLIRQT